MLPFPKTLPNIRDLKNFHKKNYNEFNTIVNLQNGCFCSRHGN
jgi:hypothetical protein